MYFNTIYNIIVCVILPWNKMNTNIDKIPPPKDNVIKHNKKLLSLIVINNLPKSKPP